MAGKRNARVLPDPVADTPTLHEEEQKEESETETKKKRQ